MAGLFTFARSANGLGISATTKDITVTGNVGDVFVVGVRTDTNITINNPTDDGSGNAWISFGQTNNTVKIATFVGLLVSSITKITISCASATTLEGIALAFTSQYNTGFTSGGGSNGSGTTEATMSVAAFTPIPHSLVVAFMTSNNAANFAATADSGYSIVNGTAFAGQYIVDPSGASTQAIFTPNSAVQTLWVERKINLILSTVDSRVEPSSRGMFRSLGRGMR